MDMKTKLTFYIPGRKSALALADAVPSHRSFLSPSQRALDPRKAVNELKDQTWDIRERRGTSDDCVMIKFDT